MKLLNNIKSLLNFTGLSFFLITAQQSTAADNMDTIVKQRQVVMDNVKNTIGTVSKAIKNNAAQEDLVKAANKFLTATSSTITIEAFKVNTHGKSDVKTTATEKVWLDWGRFEQALKDMENGAKTIQIEANNGTLNSSDKLDVVLKECGFCHRTAGYRSR